MDQSNIDLDLLYFSQYALLFGSIQYSKKNLPKKEIK